MIRKSARVEIKIRRELLAADPSDGARRGIEGVYCCVEKADQF